MKAKSFPSESLDGLAEVMQVTKILKKGKLDRYYHLKVLAAGGMSSIDRVFFDDKYLEMLLPDELLAVGAHEFTHLKQRHGAKRFSRIVVPAMLVGLIIGFAVFLHFSVISNFSFFSNLGKSLSSLLAAVFSTLCALFASFHINANWLRQQETECDLSAVQFVNGEAMVASLIKLNKLRPKSFKSLESGILPKFYPTLEKRINDIRTAENKKLRH